MADSYIVTIWNYGSEATYTFGPFNSDKELDSFDKKVWENNSYDYDSFHVMAVNSPNLFGTGNEVSRM